MNVFYAISTHWDREWYKPFQGFRYDLVKVTDGIIDALEKGIIDIFTFDGQTIVLEDYLEIRPENRDRLTNLIKEGKLKVGPWYVMPDELLVSGESIIKNFLIGKSVSEKFGTKPWSYGYMNDVFGHIAQMPQILCGFGIKAALIGRGMGSEEQNFKNFIWESPDGSRCICYKECYATFSRKFKKAENKEEAVREYIKENTDANGSVVLLYTDDHAAIDENTIKFFEIAKKAEFTEGPEKITYVQTEKNLPVQTGELITTAQIPGSFRAVTGSISSYYPLKYENDICENLLENRLSPMLVMSRLTGFMPDLPFWHLAYKYLLKNQPHDSICGCSSDIVHEDMHYRYSQVKSIVKAMEVDFKNKISSTGDDYFFSIINYSPKKYRGVFETELYLDPKRITGAKDNAGYQEYLAFDIKDENGNSVPYQILDIQKNHHDGEKPYPTVSDKYRITVYGELAAFGKTTYKLVSGKPLRDVHDYSDGELCAENKYISLMISEDGSVTLTDKESGKKYEGLNTFVDDGELGNGWFSERPVADSSAVSSKGAKTKTEIIRRSELITTFRVTKHMSVPKCADYNTMTRSADDTELKIVSEITLKKDSKAVEFNTTVHNSAKDHRLRAEFPSHTNSDSYYASQAFTFVERKRGVSLEGANYSEPECAEKNTSGIICVKDNTCGLSFISKEGIHECGVSKRGVITATMLRSFGRIMWGNVPTKTAQLQGELTYRYAVTTETDFSKLCDMKKYLFESYPNVESSGNESTGLIEVQGDIAVSIVKPSEDGQGIIIRLYNPAKEKRECTLHLNTPVSRASKANLAEEIQSDIEADKEKINLSISPDKIETLYIKI